VLERYGLAEMTEKWSEWYEGTGPHGCSRIGSSRSYAGVDIALVSGDVRDVYPEIAAKVGDAVTWAPRRRATWWGSSTTRVCWTQVLLHMTPVTLGKGATRCCRGRYTRRRPSPFRSAERVDLRVRLIRRL
jgi:hypothetical protein